MNNTMLQKSKIAALSIFYNTNFLLKPLYNSFIHNSNIDADFYVYDNSRDTNLQLNITKAIITFALP